MIACLLRIWEDAVGVIMFVCTDFLWVWLLVLARRMLLGAGRVVFIRKLIPCFQNARQLQRSSVKALAPKCEDQSLHPQKPQ